MHPLYGIRKEVKDNFNELNLTFNDGKVFQLRVYNNTVSHRFTISRNNQYFIKDEGMEILVENSTSIISDIVDSSRNFHHAHEGTYTTKKVTEIASNNASLPLILGTPMFQVALMEAGLDNFPALYFTSNNTMLRSVHPRYPLEETIANEQTYFKKVTKSADYVAKGNTPKNLPWRIFSFAKEDKDLLDNNMVYLLAPESLDDFSWVKPGKVAWDWYNNNNLTGVNFKSGVNTKTYLYYIDFAAKNGIEYINIDEGWSKNDNLLEVNDSVDLEQIITYARQKEVGVFVWTISTTLLNNIDTYLDQLSEWGVNGIKVDFLERDDQIMINNHEIIAKKAAERKLLINFHGTTKPTGLSRKYPNVLNYEAVRGLEYNKFDEGGGASPDQVAYIPFIRALAGPMDYTPGGMQYLNKRDWIPIFKRPFAQGTRMQQVALYVLFYAPLQMLADSPILYEKQPEITDVISSIPVTWDETVPVAGIIGEYAIIARRKGNQWFVAGANSWQPKKVELDLSFITSKNLKYSLFSDGPNADQSGEDYVVKKGEFQKAMQIDMAAGGGFLLIIEP